MYEELISIMIFNLAVLAIAIKLFRKDLKDEEEARWVYTKLWRKEREEWEKEIKMANYETYKEAKAWLSKSNIPRFEYLERDLKIFIKWQNKENKRKTDESLNNGGNSTWLPNNLSMEDYYPNDKKEEEEAKKEKKKTSGAPML